MTLSTSIAETPLQAAEGEQPVVNGSALELDHLGLIVQDIAVGRNFLQQTLGITRWTPVVDDPGLCVSVQFGTASGGQLIYELIAPLGEGTPIANALRTGKHILNHLAYLTPDLEASAAHLREQGCYPAGEPQPALAYEGRRVQFWMSPLRFVIELIEKPGHRHRFEEPSL
ncbi:VOC family protein [Granulicella mallensis]|jgi:methylmalonyl-CoA/ethylmalonyl-CoA epimerase|uniref:Methylmalonyl-CoA/ethylmalonyl-CoA epimerase n=1 Tax=Granulicella mallensis TaxID=940614 RepID=A0A7W8E8S6_9BACT|nr:VOC family protein [Granulicella mallensis]MBB5062926.1 methylmalonyl-CoA/ethylmalonyl-CoA epimerase [Granulicella mallensis]